METNQVTFLFLVHQLFSHRHLHNLHMFHMLILVPKFWFGKGGFYSYCGCLHYLFYSPSVHYIFISQKALLIFKFKLICYIISVRSFHLHFMYGITDSALEQFVEDRSRTTDFLTNTLMWLSFHCTCSQVKYLIMLSICHIFSLNLYTNNHETPWLWKTLTLHCELIFMS